MYRMYIHFIFILIAICILTFLLSNLKYKEGQCVTPDTPEAKKIQTRANFINKRISNQTADMTSINSRVNKILLNYSDFKFSISGVDMEAKSNMSRLEIDKKSTLSNPTFIFTLAASPKGDIGDDGKQGLPGIKGDPGTSGANGLPGYWGERGGCST